MYLIMLWSPFVVPVCCRDVHGEKSGTKMVLLKLFILCSKGTLIYLRADNSGYVVFLCVFAVCPD